MDQLFLNGRIESFDSQSNVFEAIGVSAGKIAAVGDQKELRELAGPVTEIIDLEGGFLIPGLIDSHTHLMIYAYLLDGIDLAPPKVGNIGDIQSSVQTAVRDSKPGEWIRGSRFVDYSLTEHRYPTREDLDPVSPDNPVILYHTSFHACVLNSAAIRELDLTRETPTPRGGLIEKDQKNGDPTGVLHDAAMSVIAFNPLFTKDLESMPVEKRVRMCSRAMEKFAEVGITGISDALVTPASLSIYHETLASGKASVRVYTMPEITFSEGLIASGIKTGFGSEMLKIGPIKMFIDGGMSNRTAAVKTPYKCKPFDNGLTLIPREELMALVKRINGLGYQIAVHCQGDAALLDMLDALEAVLGPRSDNPLRHRIEHAGCLYPDLLKRAADMKIGVSSQPVFFSFLGDGFVEAFGEEGADRIYPFKSILEAGIPLGGSSDCPVSLHDPRLAFQGAVTRKSPSGRIIGPDQCLTLDQAFRMFTTGSAWLSFDEGLVGTLEVGKRADFAVFEKDLREVAVEELPDVEVKMTVLGGKFTHRA